MKTIVPYAILLLLASLSIEAYSNEDNLNKEINTFLDQHDQLMKQMRHDEIAQLIAADAEIVYITKVAGHKLTSKMDKAVYINYLKETASDPERFIYQRSKIKIKRINNDTIIVSSKIKEVSYFDDKPLKLSIKQNMTLSIADNMIVIKQIEEHRKH